MPRPIDFRITGMSFEQAGKRLAAGKPPQAAKAPKPKKNAKRKK
jgi:hypothetical protein